MAQGNNIPKIEELIEKIPKAQLNILKSLWDNFLKTKGIKGVRSTLGSC